MTKYQSNEDFRDFWTQNCPLYIEIANHLEARSSRKYLKEYVAKVHLAFYIYWNLMHGKETGDGDLKNWIYRFMEHTSYLDIPDQNLIDDTLELIWDYMESIDRFERSSASQWLTRELDHLTKLQ